MNRFGGPMMREEPTMDAWRDNAITKDYNHGYVLLTIVMLRLK